MTAANAAKSIIIKIKRLKVLLIRLRIRVILYACGGALGAPRVPTHAYIYKYYNKARALSIPADKSERQIFLPFARKPIFAEVIFSAKSLSFAADYDIISETEKSTEKIL